VDSAGARSPGKAWRRVMVVATKCREVVKTCSVEFIPHEMWDACPGFASVTTSEISGRRWARSSRGRRAPVHYKQKLQRVLIFERPARQRDAPQRSSFSEVRVAGVTWRVKLERVVSSLASGLVLPIILAKLINATAEVQAFEFIEQGSTCAIGFEISGWPSRRS
jgi:hypothetical protein